VTAATEMWAKKCADQTAEIERLQVLLHTASDLLDDARSGYIGGCALDLQWDRRRDEFRAELAAGNQQSPTPNEEG